MKTPNQTLNRLNLNIFTSVLILLLTFSVQSNAQNVQHQDNTVDKSFKSDLTVDPVTLGMSFNLPLGSYVGRNGMNVPFTISYNSKVWQMEYGGYYQEGPCCRPSFDAYPQGLPTDNNYSWVDVTYATDSVSGWRLRSYYPEYVYGTGGEYYDTFGDPGNYFDNPNADYFVKRFRLRMPDGSTTEFRKDDKSYILPNTMSYPTTFYSVDSSGLKFVQETESNATLYFRDGSRYVWGTNAGYYDAHGNKIGATDTLGRTINIPQLRVGIDTGDQTYSLPGLNNTTRNYVLRWRQLKNATTGETVLSKPDDQLCSLGDSMSIGQGFPITCALFGSGGASRVTPVSTHNPVVLAEVELPDGSKYKFRYNIYGEIDKVIYPTGAYEKFEYGEVPGINPINEPYSQTNRGVKKRWVSESGTLAGEILTQYVGGGDTTETIHPDGTKTVRIIQKGRGPGVIDFGFDDARAGSIIEERFYSAGPNSQLLRRTLNHIGMEGVRGSGPGVVTSAQRDARLSKQISIIIEPDSATALMKQTVYEYDSNPDLEYFAYLNVKYLKEYEYVTVSKSAAQNTLNGFDNFATSFNSQTPVRTTKTDYKYEQDYKSRNMTNLPTKTEILDGQNNVVARTEILYDESTYLEAPTITNAPGWENPGTSVRGLATTVRKWTDIAANQYIETRTQYDQFGNVRKTWDAKGNMSEIQYADNYTDSINRNSYAFPTRTISAVPDPDPSSPHGSKSSFETTVKYDFNTGLTCFATDANGQTSESQYDNTLLRPTKVIAQNGQETITQYGVPDTIPSSPTNGQLVAGQRFVKVKTQLEVNKWKESYTWFDGIGRTVKTQSIDSNGDVFTETEYDNMSRPKKTTNPYRTAETKYWTESTYDDLSRVTKVKTPDNAEALTNYGLATTGSQIGTFVVVSDQAGKLRRSITNARGWLIRVDEPNEFNQLGAIDDPNQPTQYSYDALNNLTQARQEGKTTAQCGGKTPPCLQIRESFYDALSRLKAAVNLESGTISYSYDSNGNLKTKTDARGIKSIYDYDGLNRVVKRCYTTPNPSGNPINCSDLTTSTTNANTSPVTYKYDNLSNAKGRLIEVDNGISKTKYLGFDQMGRITSSQQIIDGAPSNPMTYTYNLSGALIEQTYPSGRTVKNTLDADGTLAQIESAKTQNGSLKVYANNFIYTAAGAVSSMRLGNGRWESTQFNTRLQPIQIALGTSRGATNLLDIDYAYGEINSNTGLVSNNGNTAHQTITVQSTAGANNGFSATQYYAYDSLNRLKIASENLNPDGDGNADIYRTWRQTYNYDRFGNRTFDEGSDNGEYRTTTLPRNCPVDNVPTVCETDRLKFNPSANVNNNRLDGYLFDAAGNTIRDGGNRKFTYDGENKQIKVETVDLNGNVTGLLGEYWYDGDGKRIKKHSFENNQWITTIFIYDASSKLVAEYATPVAQQSVKKVSYLTNDYLGSPRVITNEIGQITSRRDFQPFGEEIYSTNRTTNLNYSADDVRQKFTSYERDIETELDYAQARYYSKAIGRFYSTDMVMPDCSIPQTFNQYRYALNNPLRYIDKSGKYEEDVHYELTAVLAYAAGFSEDEGFAIAAFTQFADEHPDLEPFSSYNARVNYHFTTKERRDQMWGSFGKKASEIENEFFPENYPARRASAVASLGLFLHAFQDSYSHAGFGPLIGHAAAGHAPDKTYNDPAKANEMAEQTYNRLVEAARRMGDTGRPVPFDDNIRNFIDKFSKAKTSQEKSWWLGDLRRYIQTARRYQDWADKYRRENRGFDWWVPKFKTTH